MAAAKRSPAELVRYLTALDCGAIIRAFVGDAQSGGRFFYNADLSGFNFKIVEAHFKSLLERLMEIARTGAGEFIYMGSTAAEEIAPGFASENPLEEVEKLGGGPRLWIGTSSRIAPHYDESDNLACVVSGRRRFVLFPTDQVANLYVGPIDRTIAGQPVSMVDLDSPDYGRFPRFREAERHALIADLEPGDAIYIPALWWHAVQASGEVNLLVNYWWLDSPADAGSPTHALGHGLLTIGNLPEHKRRAWRTLFDHYVFQSGGEPAAHIPEAARGILGSSTPELRRTIKQFLVRALTSL